MIMHLVELLASNPNINEWSASDLQYLQEFSLSELEVVFNTFFSIDQISLPKAATWT